MAMNFPNTPAVGDQYVAQDGDIYRWDGVKWKIAGTGGTPPPPDGGGGGGGGGGTNTGLWTSQTLPAGWTGATAIAYGPVAGVDSFLIISNTGAAASSPDGATWTPRTPGPGSGIQYSDLCHGLGGWCLVGGVSAAGILVTSVDGLTWTVPNEVDQRSQPFTGAASGSAWYVICGSSEGDYAAIAAMGTTWLLTDFGGVVCRGIASNGVYDMVAVGDGVALNVGGAGGAPAAFVPGTIPGNTYNAVAFGGGMWVAVGAVVTASSPDGTTWTTRGVKLADSRGIAYGGGKFVAVDHGSDDALVTADGVNFVRYQNALPSGGAFGWRKVAYGAGKFVAVTEFTNKVGVWTPA